MYYKYSFGLMTTPEGKVKAAIIRALESYPESYWFMPVPYGYGKSTVDFLVCHYGLFIGIEAKAPGEKPTTRQCMILKQIADAGGEAFVIDGPEKCQMLRVFLEQVKQNATSISQPQTQDGGSAVRGADSQPVSVFENNPTWGCFTHTPTTSAHGNVSFTEDGVRRPKPNPDALHVDGSDPVPITKSNRSYANAPTARIRPKRDGDRQD